MNQLRWQGHVLQKDGGDCVMRSMLFEAEGIRGREREMVAWNQVVGRDMREGGQDWVESKRMRGRHWLTPA